MMKRSAFTMVELIFAIVVIGILSAVALPKFSTITDFFKTNTLKQDLKALQSELATIKKQCIMRGDTTGFGTISVQAACCCPTTATLPNVVTERMSDMNGDAQTALINALSDSTKTSYDASIGVLTIQDF